MTDHKVVSKEDWVDARKVLLGKEKEFTRLRDELSAERRRLPWNRIEKDYSFDGPNGKQSLADLFGNNRQLLVTEHTGYHSHDQTGDETGKHGKGTNLSGCPD